MARRVRMAWLLTIPALLALCGCGAAEQTAGQTVEVTDLLGRRVSVPASVRSVVAIGPGALRLYVYAGDLQYVAGVEQVDIHDVSGKPYILANPSLSQLPVIGLGGPNNAPDPEKLLAVKTQVIFSTYAQDAEAADELQDQTGIPVVVLSYGSQGFGVTSIFGQPIQDSLRLIGRITGETAKSEAAIAFLLDSQRDLSNRTEDIPEDGKPSVYIGGLGSQGLHGMESTQGRYALLDVLHAKNVVDETGKSGAMMVDKEQLLEWDPEYLFLDMLGYASVLEDYRKNTAFYESLSAVRNGRVYSQLPYNYYSTNLDTAIADAYYLGKILFPEAFADIDPAEKADEIYLALLGQPVYDKMTASFGGFRQLQLGD
ncbi:MAG: iron ABC transporter substrate-binding protein [Anaerolineales bacterium]|nr:iron ABC transporter substrate-binding protein [Anaerolineales bacterium]